jgi:hypothetical protein
MTSHTRPIHTAQNQSCAGTHSHTSCSDRAGPSLPGPKGFGTWPPPRVHPGRRRCFGGSQPVPSGPLLLRVWGRA